MRAAHRTSLHGRIWLKLALMVAFLGAGAALLWMLALPPAVAAYVRHRTGCDTEIGSLYVNPFTGHLDLENLVIANPPGFPRPEFLRVRVLEIDAGPRALFGRRRVIDRVRLDVASVAIVRDQRGRINARLVGRSAASGAAPSAPATAAPAGGGFLIRQLDVRLDRVVIADYSTGTPVVREHNLDFHHTYANVTSVQQLAEPLAAALGNLTGAIDTLLPEWGGLLRRTRGRLEEAGRKAGETLKDVFESLEKSLGK